jgi:hypothetical protein
MLYTRYHCVTGLGSVPKEQGKKDTARKDLGQDEAKHIEILFKSYKGFL